jgi:acyl carrier protein
MAEAADEIRELIIESLKLEGVTAADIDVDAPLFGAGLGLDSIDALELGVALQRRYGLVISSNPEESREHFASVTALSAFVQRNRTK